MSWGLAALCFLLLLSGALGFGILPGKSLNHLEITESAILNVTVEVCRALAKAEGTDFNPPGTPYTAGAVAVACGASESSKSFREAITFIMLRNVRVDLRHALNASFHFDEESFAGGRSIIAEGLQAVKASNKQQNYEAARQKLGEILHPLQDFYSHSNWVEVGFTLPNPNLLRSDTSIGNLADESRATCRSCVGDDCRNNILEDVIEQQILTSGYFGIVPITSTKPKGKCSHGGAVDQTSTIEPTGGINKDSFDASHGHLHTDAANMAIAATSQLLEDVRRAAGDKEFLQMLGVSKGSSKALCFVVDTTKSMSDDIAAVRDVTASIIDSEVGTENEPAVYILVPFNDPDVGPLIKTTDPKIFKVVINTLSAAGGGDDAELSLSGLQLALSNAPSNSEIFLFTDAPAKDTQLKNTVIALMERTQSVVNFLISGSTVLNRIRRSNQKQIRISESEAQVYRDLSKVSGGLVIEVSKSELPEATSIISEASSASLVTLLFAARSPGRTETFPFLVDDTVTRLTVYMTGSSIAFTLTSPTGDSQQSTDGSGSLISSYKLVGNFRTLRLNKQAGLWQIKMVSSHPYTVKVVGQSPVDFLFDFVALSQGPFSGYDVLDSRPQVGVNGSLLVSLAGSDTATVTEVVLVESSDSRVVAGTLEPQGSGNFLAHFATMPSAEFGVRVKGRDDGASGSSVVFQRQSTISFRASNLTITADKNSILVPGTLFPVPFTVMTSGAGGQFTIRATNSRSFKSTSPTSLTLETGTSVNGTVTLSAPRTTLSGTDVTLTIEAEAPGGEDTNYVVLRFTVINPITDFVQPACQLITLQSNCSANCSAAMWDLRVRVTDGADGAGVERVSLRSGSGNLSTSPAADNPNITMVTYVSSCCSPDVELLVVDRVGNDGTCFFTARQGSQSAQSGSSRVSPSPLLGLGLLLSGLRVLTQLGSH